MGSLETHHEEHPSPSSPVTGGCLCRNIRYELTAPPLQTVLCHCPNCKASSGSAYICHILFPVAAVTVNLHSATYPDTKETYPSPSTANTSSPGSQLCLYYDKDTLSESPILRYFCRTCGSNVFLTTPRKPEAIVVTLGSLDREFMNPEVMESEGWKPAVELFEKKRIFWSEKAKTSKSLLG